MLPFDGLHIKSVIPTYQKQLNTKLPEQKQAVRIRPRLYSFMDVDALLKLHLL